MARKKKEQELPADLADLIDELEQPEKPAKPKLTELQKAYQMVAGTKEGLTVLKHVFDLTGFGAPLRILNTSGGLDIDATMYNFSRRDLWLSIMPHLSPDARRKIEIPEDINA